MIEDISYENIENTNLRTNFRIVKDVFQNSPFLQGNFKFFVIEFSANGTYNVTHNLKFLPTDVLVTSVVGGTAVFNYSNFNRTDVELTITGVTDGTPCRVRAFIGSYPDEVVR